MTLVFVHPLFLFPKLRRIDGDEKLGVTLDYLDSGVSLLIKDIYRRGLIQQWNECNAENEVKPFDRIVEVNGMRGLARKLLERLQDPGSSILELTVVRAD